MTTTDRRDSDPLLQPYQLKHLRLRNRLLITSHEPAYSEDGMPKARYRAYHVARARGGAALTMTAGSAVVSADSPPAFGNLHAYDDRITPWLAELADAVKAEGAAVMIQITHLGRRTRWDKGDWLPTVAPSQSREPAHRGWAKEAEAADLERIVADYADAAERIAAAGLDGLELEAYGHLLDQFWSPGVNQRADDYGGSLENRMRLSEQVIAAVRARVGPDFLLGVRMVADERWDVGLSEAEGRAIARRLAERGDVDFLNIIRGHIHTDAGLTDTIPIHGAPSAPHLDFAGAIRAETGAAVFHAAKIADVATARHAISAGLLDMVGMTRAHMADPEIGRKVAEGREHAIRPCVGASYCIDRIYLGGEALCIHNPATGREETLPQGDVGRSAAPLAAVVVGAGPAGLETARVLAERGHRVSVLEAGDRAGGQINLITRSARRRDMAGVADWRLAQAEAAGADFRFGVFAEAEDVLALSPDLVVIATGGTPHIPDITGADLAISSWDVLSGAVSPEGAILVYDDDAGHAGLQTAEMLAGRGAEVEWVSPERMIGAEIGGLNHAAYARAFARTGVRTTLNQRLTALRRDGNQILATLGSDYAAETALSRRVDHVVVEAGTTPLDDLYQTLKPASSNQGAASLAGDRLTPARRGDGAFVLLRVGDAVASRNIHAAVLDGLRVGLSF